MTPYSTRMSKITIQTFLDNQWHDAAEVVFIKPELGHRGQSRLDYLPQYVIEHMDGDDEGGARVSGRYPVSFESHTASDWPAFLLDLLPGGEGRRRWIDRLDLSMGPSSELALLQHAAANPVGHLRIAESVASVHRSAPALPDESGVLTSAAQHKGFSRESLVRRQEHFIEYAYQLGAAVSGATDVQGEAPKFLLVQNLAGRWHAEGALQDLQVTQHWIVKFARGKTTADQTVLRNESGYLEVARQFGLTVGKPLQYEEGALFIPRFDRLQREGKTQRLAMESLYSLAGVCGFGVAPRHEQLCHDLMEQILPEDRMDQALEYIKRDVLNVIMGNTDNHGRNTAVLRDQSGRITLSPLYDFAPMYLDPEGIARVTRWDNSRETAGQPDWRSVAAFFEAWMSTDTLIDRLADLIEPLSTLSGTMQSAGIDPAIIERCRPLVDTVTDQFRGLQNA